MNEHTTFMHRCLQLARLGSGHVAPNPMVGSVIVNAGKIIGEGYHQQFGEAHAEVNAINSVTDQTLLQNSTLYVNLEPCSHFGKTPPCADLIVQKKIPRVVIGSYDPNPYVSGRGIKKLKASGVDVVTEISINECNHLNRRFITFHTKQRPYIILKWAQSTDGFMASSEPKQIWLSNELSRKLAHKWRSEEQAILTGRNTIAVDDSELTTRLWNGVNPVRIVIDRDLTLTSEKKIFNTKAKTIVFNTKQNCSDNNVDYVRLNSDKDILGQIMKQLCHFNILSVIIEGGAFTLHQFIRKNLWDEARYFITPHVLKHGKAAPVVTGIIAEEHAIGNDLLKILNNPAA